MVEPVYCVHCGAVAKHPVTKIINGQPLSFCCGGCLQIYEMLLEEGLPAGQSKPGAQTDPQTEAVVPPQSQTGPSQTITLQVGGMTCSNCVNTVTRRLRSVSGVLDASVILETGRATVKTFPGKVSMADLKRAVEKAGYQVS
jgi:copper chaperone CopZ